MPKRGRSKSRVRANYARVTSASLMGRARGARAAYKRRKTLSQQVRALTRTVETKEGTNTIRNVQLAHNNLTVFNRTDGTVWNPFQSANGNQDQMSANTMERIGDQITVQRLRIKFFIETSLGRSNVHFKFFLVKMAKGETLNRANFFKGSANNKMIDDINTERFTVMASKTVRIKSDASAPPTSLVALTGVPNGVGTAPISGTRIVTMTIPGRKFGRGGTITYENQSGSQVKFYDYRLCCVAYDWYGTPQDENNVGFVNEGFSKTYFKDA